MSRIFTYPDQSSEKEVWFSACRNHLQYRFSDLYHLQAYPMTYVDGRLLVDPQKMMNDGYGDTAFLIALCIGRYIERKWIRFTPTGLSAKGFFSASLGWSSLFF